MRDIVECNRLTSSDRKLIRHGDSVVVCVVSKVAEQFIHLYIIQASHVLYVDTHDEPTHLCNIASCTHTCTHACTFSMRAQIYNHTLVHTYQVFRSSVFMNLLYTFQHAWRRFQKVVDATSLAAFIGCWLLITVYLYALLPVQRRST